MEIFVLKTKRTMYVNILKNDSKIKALKNTGDFLFFFSDNDLLLLYSGSNDWIMPVVQKKLAAPANIINVS